MVKDRGKFWGMLNTRLLPANLDSDSVPDECPTLENFALILFFSVLFGTSFSRQVWCSERFTWLTVVTSAIVFLVVLLIGQQRWNSEHGIDSSGFCGNPRVW